MRATSVQVWDKDAGSEDDLMGVAEISKLERFRCGQSLRCAAARIRALAHSRTRAAARTCTHRHTQVRTNPHPHAPREHARARILARSSIAAEKCHRRLQDGTFVRNPEIFLSGTRARAHTRVRVRAFTRVLVRVACVSAWHGAGRARWSARR